MLNDVFSVRFCVENQHDFRRRAYRFVCRCRRVLHRRQIRRHVRTPEKHSRRGIQTQHSGPYVWRNVSTSFVIYILYL